MLEAKQKNVILNELLGALELPASAYEKARDRYNDIGDWLDRRDSSCRIYCPHIYSQGSFRFGTAIKPLDPKESYDLDLACVLESGIDKGNSTQKQLKLLIGDELEEYRNYRNIEKKIEEKHRCWRLDYKDQINFHIDIVPCIPEKENKRILIKEVMIKSGRDKSLSDLVSKSSVSITDNTLSNYEFITDDWNVSNPDGYAKWFESRMRRASDYLIKRAMLLKEAKIDDIPVYEWKTPLQICIQLLKRHRDEMYKDHPDSKPISIIITTLAAEAYEGESDLSDALMNILYKMESFIKPLKPFVSNPVNPKEDFADKWYNHEYGHLRLQDNFNSWLAAAQSAFEIILSSDDVKMIQEQALQKFGSGLDEIELKNKIGISAPSIIAKTKKIDNPVEPWMEC